ncbi:MAG TPA: hypothetical protein VGE35_00125 [Candidatus Paceibacterota bacterium]
MITSSLRTSLKRTSSGILLGFIAFAMLIPTLEALAADAIEYVPLTTIPGLTVGCKPSASGSTAGCATANPVAKLTNLYGLSIGIAAVLAVIMIIWAGIEYATAEAITGKSDAKEKWHGAFMGLGLLLCSYLLLRTINIDLVKINLSLGSLVTGTEVDSGILERISKQSDDRAAAALSQHRTNEANLEVETRRLNEADAALENMQQELADIDRTNPANQARIRDLEKRIGEAEASRETIATNRIKLAEAVQQSAFVTLSARGASDIAKVIDANKANLAEASELARTRKEAVEDAMMREIRNIPAGPAKDKATATLTSFNSIASQQIVSIKSFDEVQKSVGEATAKALTMTGTYQMTGGSFGLSGNTDIQNKIRMSRQALVDLHSSAESAVRANDPSQVEELRRQSVAQREAFDIEMGRIAGCAGKIEVASSGVVSCKN